MSAGDRSMPPVLIMAGGTGGHVFPALAVARELLARGVPVVWLGTRRGLEARVVPEAGIPVEWLTVSGLRGTSVVRRLRAPFMLMGAAWQAFRVLWRRKPVVVLGMGGFATGPGGVVARLLGRPLCIHEQNAIAGLTNRLLSRIANRVLEAFPDTFPQRRRPQWTGNPVRADIGALPAPEIRFRDRRGPLRLLVLGGSQGARALNEVVPGALGQMADPERPEVWHQTGSRNQSVAERAYRDAGVQARLAPFIDDMAQAYAWADLVLCRAGALTVAELAAAGVGSVLVPYPYAVDDHQTHNAGYLVDGGAALLVSQSQLSPDRLAGLLKEFAAGRERLLAMATAARGLALPEAARRVADACLAIARPSVAVKEGP